MANYLYNGVALPKIPDAPSANSMATFTRATIIRTSAGGYRMYWSGSTYRIDVYTKSDGTEELYAYNRPYNFWSYYWDYKAATNAWVYGGGGAYAASTASACFPAEDVIWTNYDLKYVDGTTVYLASSEPVAPTVTGITLNQTEVSINRGGTFQFSAVVSGTGSYDDSVTYSLSGNSANGGTTLTAAGLLTIGANESSPTITVTATSVQDSTVSRSAVVTVADFLSKLTAVVPQGGVVFDGTVTTVEENGLCAAEVEALSDFSAGDQLLVEFNGATFTVVADPFYGDFGMFGNLTESGEPDFTEMPVCGISLDGMLAVVTETPGTYSLKIEKPGGVTDTTATVKFTCSDLLDTDSVYRIAAWVYKVTDGLDTTVSPTWISGLFAGPTHSESHTFTGLTPATDYAVYGVIAAGDAATEHHAEVVFTTAEGGLESVEGTVYVNDIKAASVMAWLVLKGIDSNVEYTAEFSVFRNDASGVLEKVQTFTGDEGIQYCAFTGLLPNTAYVLAVNCYPTDGESIYYGECEFTTLEAAGFTRGFAGVEAVARRLIAACREENGTAQTLTVFFGDRNGLTQSL